jgi:hypothetical protein
MKVEAKELKRAEEVLGPAGETEFTFMLVPVELYRVLSEHSREQGCSVGQVFQRAVLQYLRRIDEADSSKQEAKDVQRSDAPARAVIVKRGR